MRTVINVTINDVMRAPPTGPEDEFSTVNK